MKKFSILKTFDVFNSQAMSILRERIINLICIETDNFFIKDKSEKKAFLSKIVDENNEESTSITADTAQDGSVQISVIGNPKVYNLLSYTLSKYKALRTVPDPQSLLKGQEIS